MTERVGTWEDADVVFVPFFATLSAEMELGWGRKGWFGKKGDENRDYVRQMEVFRNVTGTDAWRRSGGKDHVFVLTGSNPVAMVFLNLEAFFDRPSCNVACEKAYCSSNPLGGGFWWMVQS